MINRENIKPNMGDYNDEINQVSSWKGPNVLLTLAEYDW